MDKLIDKQYKDYGYTTRYANCPIYYHTEDGKYVMGTMQQMKKTASYFLHKVTQSDTLNSLALKYYNNPTYYWVLAMFNDINDVIDVDLYGEFNSIKIPKITSVSYGDER